jgi:hypothetical protein
MKEVGGVRPKVGYSFNPYKKFLRFIIVPESILSNPDLSHGAKLVYGILAQHAGEDGNAYPSVARIARILCLKPRRTRSILEELETYGLIRRIRRTTSSGPTSNAFEFLWHQSLDDYEGGAAAKNYRRGRHDSAPGLRQKSTAKENPDEEIKFKSNDLDCSPANRSLSDPQASVYKPASVCMEFSGLKQVLTKYMQGQAPPPSDIQVAKVMEAANGAREEDVIAHLKYLYRVRGYRPGTRCGPAVYSWFITVVRNHFEQVEHQREAGLPPVAYAEWEERNEVRMENLLSRADRDRMTEAIEIPPEFNG